MRTTLDIDDDLLAAAKELARRERKSTGRVVSELVRKALTGGTGSDDNDPGVTEDSAFYGFRPFASGGKVVTNEDIDKLRDELDI